MLTNEQRKERKTGLGGSDAAAICGLSKYVTPIDIFLDKTSSPIREQKEELLRGNLLEPLVGKMFSHKTGLLVQEVNKTQRSYNKPFMLANLDGYLPTERKIVEFKTAHLRNRQEWGKEGTDEIPKEYLTQVAHYASVMNLEGSMIGVLFGDENTFENLRVADKYGIPLSELKYDFRIYEYKRTQGLENNLIAAEEHFWYEHVQKRIMPPIMTAEDALKAFPVAEDRDVIANQEQIWAIAELSDLREKKKEIERLETDLKKEIFSIFGSAKRLITDTGITIATLDNRSRKTLDQKAFEESNPGVLNGFFKITTFRELRIA